MSEPPRRMLVTGGAGFIGINAALHFATDGWEVTIYDNLARAGTAANLGWILGAGIQGIRFVQADIRDRKALDQAVRGQDAVLHLAAQVAVTTSLIDPQSDFDINAGGTFNLIEAVRAQAPDAALVFASTNKVYGALEGWTFYPTASQWVPGGGQSAVGEAQPLDFHSPYGCSKGAADQYVRDFARCYGLRAVVLRQSCIYGPHQNGNEDQGWVAHFVHSVARGKRLTIYGDGRQVRDLLDVRDLCRLYSRCIDGIDGCTGQIFNVGGGPANARSVLEVLHQIEALLDSDATYDFADWRAGDQVFYVSDISRAEAVLGWQPGIGFEPGLQDLVQWVLDESTAESAIHQQVLARVAR